MLNKLKAYIDKDAFWENVLSQLKQYDKLVIDSFVSNTCNLSCSHCYFLDYKPKGKALTYKQWSEILRDFTNYGVKHFHFSGKEPFCDKRIPKLLSLLDKEFPTSKLYYGLVTNGTKTNARYINSLLETNLSYLEFSIEGTSNYNKSVRGDDHYGIVEQLIGDVNDKSKINITSTIYPNNLNELLEMTDHFHSLGLSKFNFAPYLFFVKEQFLPKYGTTVETVLNFIGRCQSFLKEKSYEASSIDIRICLTPYQCYELFISKNVLSPQIDDYIYKGKDMVFHIGNHILEINYPLLSIPYMSQIVVTHDGYTIPCADDIHYENFYKFSLGNLAYNCIEEIFIERENFIIKYINDNFNN